MTSFKLEVWRGDGVAARLLDIAAEAIDETNANAVTRAMQLAPVKTGNLKNNIAFEKATREGKSRVVGKLLSRADYSLWVEIGTRRTRAQPFLRPAAEAEFPQLLGRIRSRLT